MCQISKIALPMDEKKQFAADFVEFLSVIETLVDEWGMDFEGAADEPDLIYQRLNLSFDLDQEAAIDKLIRYVRDNLTSNYTECYLNEHKGKYPLAVWKSHIISAKCWSVQFYFATNWNVEEDIQG